MHDTLSMPSKLLAALRTTFHQGLSTDEGTARLSVRSPPAGPSPKNRRGCPFSRDNPGMLPLILVVAAGLSLAVGEVLDAATIGEIIRLNGLLGFTPE